MWRASATPKDNLTLIRPLPLPVLAKESAPVAFHLVSGIKLLGAPIGNEAHVSVFLREQMACIDDLLSAFERINNPHVSTEM